MAEITTEQITQQKVFWISISSTTKTFFILISLFAVPFFLSGPQLLIGSIVNILLIFVALNYKNYYAIIPMIMLPSIAAVLHGVMFGSLFVLLPYLMPAIWIGNFLLVYTIQQSKQLISWIVTGGLYKSIFLVIVAYVLIYFWILPVIFLKAMWLYQLLTVIMAWIAVLTFQKLTAK